MNLKKILTGLVFLIGIVAYHPIMAQVAKQTDYSGIRVDNLSDDQIRNFISQFEAKGLTQNQLDQEAQAGGMSPQELQKLHIRIDKLKTPATTGQQEASGRQLSTKIDTAKVKINPKTEAEKALAELKSKIYGSDIFNNVATLIPNFNMATPVNYQIGPNDQIIINVSGNSAVEWKLNVSPEGTINIPGAGVLNLGGKTIEQARILIRNRLIQNNYTIGRGTELQVSLGNIRTIQVILNGEVVKPGTYPLPSFATAFNALYASGGPNENGSFRQIIIIRAGRKIDTLDIYDFIQNGSLNGNVTLQDQDIIQVPPYQTRVEVVGQVKHPGIFEMLPGENVSDLLKFAGGFTERAYRKYVQVTQTTSKELRLTGLDFTDPVSLNFAPTHGDKYKVSEIIERYENRVSIQGAVFRPDYYELKPGLTLGGLIRQAEGLREDAFISRGQIFRMTDNLQRELVPFFNISEILAGQAPDILLKREDIVNISSINDLKEEYNISVQGEVQGPGIFPFAEGTNLEDAIMQAGGFKEGATSQRVDVSRRVKNSDVLSMSAMSAQVFTLNVNQDFALAAQRFILQPFDIITVRPSSGYEIQKQVQIVGEVVNPGPYTITKKNERISDLLKRAGGFTAFAYPEGASRKRVKRLTSSDSMQNRLRQIRRLQRDTLNIDDNEVSENNYIGINLPAILNSVGDKEDIFLEEGDIIYVPKQLQTVKVSGQVLSPNTAVYIRNKTFKQYIYNAGGFSDRSSKQRAYILYANGSVKSTKRILFFNNYPVVKPGAEIFVPQKADKKKLSATEILGLTTGMASLAAIVLSLLK